MTIGGLNELRCADFLLQQRILTWHPEHWARMSSCRLRCRFEGSESATSSLFLEEWHSGTMYSCHAPPAGCVLGLTPET